MPPALHNTVTLWLLPTAALARLERDPGHVAQHVAKAEGALFIDDGARIASVRISSINSRGTGSGL